MRKADIKRSNRGRRRVSKNVWKMGNRRAGGTVPSVTMRPGGSGAVSGVEAPMVTAEMGRISGATEIAGASTAASRRQMGATSRTRMDDCVSVATLGSFGTASWVAGHFLEDESRRSGGDDGCGWEINGRLEESSGSLHACKQCSNEYDSRSALRVHMDRVHRGDSAGGAATAGFECPHCGKAFTRRSEMGRHVGNQHDNRTSFLHCERCSFKHEDAECFQRHVAEQHKRCKHCFNEFKQLKKHENSCHLKPG